MIMGEKESTGGSKSIGDGIAAKRLQTDLSVCQTSNKNLMQPMV